MSKIVNVEVPDIGDFSDVDIIEVLVSKGDIIAEEDPLITLESDKASIEIPAPSAGKVVEVVVSVNDKVNQGDLILKLEVADAAGAEPPAPEKPKAEETKPEAGACQASRFTKRTNSRQL
jgi:pyruvate/2-oxoglutarate dehydrogenase complex dihydrolipoamide acyltransferase (E2) component